MTQWVENPSGGRARGPLALARAWAEVLVRPRRFFRTAVAPGDQAPGLVFAMTVVLVGQAIRYAAVPDSIPTFVAGRPLLSAVLALALAVLLVVPAVLHLIAALQTLLLMAFVRDRAGVSETVQVVGYSTAPTVLIWLPVFVVGSPVLEVHVATTLYGATLLALGTSELHDIPFTRAAVLTALPAALVFGYGFGGFAALGDLLVRWYII